MPWGVVAGAAISAVGSYVAADKQSGAIKHGQDQADARLAPYADAGMQAVGQQGDLLGLHGQDAADTAFGTFRASPGYQYQMTEGLRAVDSGAAAKGMLRSGATLKAEQTLGNNLADTDFGTYYSRLNSLATIGGNAAAGQATVDTNAAGAQAGIAGQEVKGITSAASGLLGNSSVQNGLSSMYSGGGGGVEQGGWSDGSGSSKW
jgi:hypothetical protein